MLITAEISLYPLVKDYEKSIIKFIKALRANSELQVLTHSMSTFIKGENTIVFDAISKALSAINDNIETLSLVIKVINRDLPIEQGFLSFEN